MNALNFVNKAIDKKTLNYNMLYPYRDTDKLVATDGHRIHFVNQPKIEKPYFIGAECELTFPDYSRVLPSDSSLFTFEIGLTDSDYKAIKLITECAKFYGKKQPCTKLDLGKNDLGHFFKLSTHNYTKEPTYLNASHKSAFYSDSAHELLTSVFINPIYLIDALPESQKHGASIINIDIFKQGYPILIHNDIGTACIMPMKG